MISNANNTDSIQFIIDPSAPSNVSFAIKEALKTIRANIVLSMQGDGCKKIVITSSIPGEGKTTSSINIAIALSMIDKKVLLVDTDLRKRRVGRLVKLQHNKGLTDVIRGDCTFEEVVNTTKYENLNILSAGSSVVNPSEVIASKQTEQFFESISDKYDYILFDAPPINIVSDALPLIKSSDGVLFVAREMLTTHREIKKALTALSMIDANIIGVVYIGSDSTQPYYHSRYGKYGYGYGKYGRYGAKYYGYNDDDNNN